MDRRALALGLAILSGCSLRSLDYLEAGRGGGGKGGAEAGSAPSDAGTAPSGGTGTATGGTDAGEPSYSGTAGSSGSGGSGGAEEMPPDCSDSLTTSDETDVDCGGRTCEPCAADKKCLAGTDCQSAICTNQVCQAPSCTDLAVNGDETDRNCGGSCPGCAQGLHCEKSSDCATSKCEEGVCVSATCVEGVLSDGCPLLVDNTPYTFAPSHSPTRCLDVAGMSVVDGGGIVLWACGTVLQQTFWAVDQKDGYFALRGALSGKCLQVRGSSTVDGAAIEQSSCDYAPGQLWKPARVDDSVMQLTSKLTGFFLDVDGNDVSSDGQTIVQSMDGASADTRWRVEKRSAAAYIAFAPYANQGIRIRHEGSAADIEEAESTSSHWKVVPGLDDATLVSFQSRDEPGRYLRHAQYRLWADSNDGSTQFKRDATFRYKSPFVGTDSRTKAIESSNYPGYFWHREGTATALRVFQSSDTYKNQATWWLFVP